MRKYKHIWGQGIIDYRKKDLASLKLSRCLDTIKRFYPLHTGKVLEIGCGAGRFIRSMKIHFPGFEYSGCDIDADAIKLARSYNDGITYEVADAADLPFHEQVFNIIILVDILEHVGDTRNLLLGIARIAMPGALLYSYVPCEAEPNTLYWILNKFNIGRGLLKKHAGHIHKFRKNEVVTLFRECGFSILDVSYSTYLTGQLFDFIFYALQGIPVLKEKLLTAHATKDNSQVNRSLFYRIFKKLINIAFYISYQESVFFKKDCGAQGLHLTCIR